MKNISKLAILLVALTGNLCAVCPTEDEINVSNKSDTEKAEIRNCGYFISDDDWAIRLQTSPANYTVSGINY